MLLVDTASHGGARGRCAGVSGGAALSDAPSEMTPGLFVVYVSQQLNLHAPGYGLMLAAIASALPPALLLTRVGNPAAQRFVLHPYIVRAAVDAMLAVTRIPAVAIGALACNGIGTSGCGKAGSIQCRNADGRWS